MTFPLKLTANLFMDPWGKTMKDLYVAELTTNEKHLPQLLELLQRLIETGFGPEFASAEDQTDGYTEDHANETVTLRFLVRKDRYAAWKQTAKDCKRAMAQ